MASVFLDHIGFENLADKVSLQDFTLKVPDRQCVVITGKNQASRSQLISLIAGEVFPSTGNVYMDDVDVTQLPTTERKVGLLTPSIALYPHLNLYDNIAFGLKFSGLSKEEIRVKVEEMASVLEFSHLLPRKLRALSTGQRQRAVLGKILVQEPTVLLVDEQLLCLEDRYRVQMRYFLRNVHNTFPVTCFYATEDNIDGTVLGADAVYNLYHLS